MYLHPRLVHSGNTFLITINLVSLLHCRFWYIVQAPRPRNMWIAACQSPSTPNYVCLYYDCFKSCSPYKYMYMYYLCSVVHSLVNKWSCLWTVQATVWFFYKTLTLVSLCVIYQREAHIHQGCLRLATMLVSSRFTCREQTTAISSTETFGAISLAASHCPERILYCFHEKPNRGKCLVFCRGITYRQVFVQ